MDLRDFAEKLSSESETAGIVQMLRELPPDDAPRLAAELRNVCYENWNSEPTKAQGAAKAAAALADLHADPSVRAAEAWIRGIASLTNGELETAVDAISDSRHIFLEGGEMVEAAKVTVAMLIPLALLGRYDEAVEAGNEALRAFESAGDTVAAGKIEMNLSNIAARRGDHREALRYAEAARDRFAATDEAEWRTLAENDLANTYAELNDFSKAREYYEAALGSAESAGMVVTQAEIEACLGNLATVSGRFDDALRFLERSRRRFEQLDMPHQSAIAELEIAGIYRTLNLIPEAASIYESAAENLKELKLQGEEARARTELARLRLAEGSREKALEELGRAGSLHAAEGRDAGLAEVLMIRAEMELDAGDAASAHETVKEALSHLGKDHARLSAEADLLKGEALRRAGRTEEAEASLRKTRVDAEELELPGIELLATNYLGLAAASKGDLDAARQLFTEAILSTEQMRDPIAGEEFRMAFLADKLEPYDNLSALLIEEGDLSGALETNERARGRTLAEAVAGRSSAGEDDGGLSEQKRELRERLNWLYSKMERAEEEDIRDLEIKAREMETRLADVSRRMESVRVASGSTGPAELSLAAVQEQLGPDRALVEYIERDGGFSAFVVTSGEILHEVLPADTTDVLAALEGLRFQFGAMRYGAGRLSTFARQLKERADRHLQDLHSMVLEPLLKAAGGRNLVIVPAGALNYVPFPALHDGDRYEAEAREITSVPGASVWLGLEKRDSIDLSGALLIGAADEHIPNVEEEIAAVAGILPDAQVFTGDRATFANYGSAAEGRGLIHLACHGRFRPDNPLFSSLHLADGYITVRDICSQRLRPGLVTLSACETGLNSVFPGNEILGLARGFLTAGASTIVLSLWTVSDAATLELMTGMYRGLQLGQSVSASLNGVRQEMIANGMHPYYWAPFGIIGRS